MKIEFQVITASEVTTSIKYSFADALKRQGKVQGDLSRKADRCKLICIARIGGELVGIGAIKPATQSAFSAEKSALSRLRAEFNWELGYLFTDPAHAAKGIGKNIARLLVDEHGKENLMASTEISANPRMVKILEALGFRHYGKSWKSAIHNNYIGLFLKFQ